MYMDWEGYCKSRVKDAKHEKNIDIWGFQGREYEYYE